MAIRPFHGMDRSLDRVFDSWPEFPFGWMDGGELVERDGEYRYVLDLPGFAAEEIDLRFDDGTLSIVAEHEDGGDLRSRRRSVREHVHVPGTIEREEVAATYNNGVLEVVLPVAESDDDRTRIEIAD